MQSSSTANLIFTNKAAYNRVYIDRFYAHKMSIIKDENNCIGITFECNSK